MIFNDFLKVFWNAFPTTTIRQIFTNLGKIRSRFYNDKEVGTILFELHTLCPQDGMTKSLVKLES